MMNKLQASMGYLLQVSALAFRKCQNRDNPAIEEYVGGYTIDSQALKKFKTLICRPKRPKHFFDYTGTKSSAGKNFDFEKSLWHKHQNLRVAFLVWTPAVET